jgi:hypothetical protein
VKVVVSLRARSDILDIHLYLSERCAVAGDRMLARFHIGSMSFANSLFLDQIEASLENRSAVF